MRGQNWVSNSERSWNLSCIKRYKKETTTVVWPFNRNGKEMDATKGMTIKI
jgi:hypothetical protein